MKLIDVEDPRYIDDENPEWTQEDIDNALTFEQMPPALQALVIESRERKRGRPVAQTKKVSVTIRYSQSVIDAFKSTGKGWQSRMNQVLEDYVSKAL
ncbi:BrnA antitoxin family protein [Actinobacillus equuli]|uniref:BrnA antitoxin family protein n=1 Tax=Actinobacillus equuli TaxID=718 RepID=UPI0024436DFD|nr:BrnA antitoxin family protein [Actinobacillus equuli]WGE43028.1 BrnA antitoxin family protein [Actinobacillus equuli subsp. haemolyticus]WGE51639.1 BrnA antitoxin family protein [Actinobacillus equuli subsp. haemolyticus]WGE53744.1 BrnA antitoxin family protein [Actinobacillus equuli subsp. haemolyticus]WGE74181.1 BrnA antitoxin family protein [Actinobacillus equuli subsp. haemolyticus]WGE84099.1 BrnA antitoxin family protein [Actinobacillus equuli subsp. equuli]